MKREHRHEISKVREGTSYNKWTQFPPYNEKEHRYYLRTDYGAYYMASIYRLATDHRGRRKWLLRIYVRIKGSSQYMELSWLSEKFWELKEARKEAWRLLKKHEMRQTGLLWKGYT